jgi:hypothetical protein
MNRRQGNQPVEYEVLEDVVPTPELDARVNAAIEQTEREVEATRVDFRWGKAQVETVKRVAAMMGVPYQTYIKEAIFRQAVADIRAITDAGECLAG